MRKLLFFVCASLLAAALAGFARAEPDVGTLSVEGGRGVVVLEVRGSILGRLTSGSIMLTDRSPNDAYAATVTGKKILVERRLGPAKVFIRGQGLRFRMHGRYRVVIRGSGIALSVVGRGGVQLDGERLLPWEDPGIYSVDGADCSLEPDECVPLPDEPLRLKLGTGSDGS